MATGQPPVNSAAIMTQGAGLTGQMTGAPVASGQKVWMGKEFAKPFKTAAYYGSTTTAATIWQAQNSHAILDPDTAKGLYKWLDPAMRLKAYQAVARISGHDKNPDWTVQSFYEKAVDGAPVSSMLMGRPVSVFEELDRMGQAAEEMRALGAGSGAYGSGGGGGGGGGGGPSTSVQYNLSSESDAEALVDSALNSYLGRQADEKERAKFWSVLTKAQRANPTVTHVSPSGDTVTSTTTGGVNQQQAAAEFALSRKDAAEYMANTQYTDWLMKKIANDETGGIASGLYPAACSAQAGPGQEDGSVEDDGPEAAAQEGHDPGGYGYWSRAGFPVSEAVAGEVRVHGSPVAGRS